MEWFDALQWYERAIVVGALVTPIGMSIVIPQMLARHFDRIEKQNAAMLVCLEGIQNELALFREWGVTTPLK